MQDTNSRAGAGIPPIKVLQLNINRQDRAYYTALQLAFKNQVDIVLFQEPYCLKNYCTGNFIGLQHPAFHTIPPQPAGLTELPTRPQVLTYICKASGLDFTP